MGTGCPPGNRGCKVLVVCLRTHLTCATCDGKSHKRPPSAGRAQTPRTLEGRALPGDGVFPWGSQCRDSPARPEEQFLCHQLVLMCELRLSHWEVGAGHPSNPGRHPPVLTQDSQLDGTR